MADFPFSNAAPPGPFATDSSYLRRVLVVDDDRPLSTLLSVLLRQYQFVVDVANNGEDALRLAGAFTYDAVVLDLQMPGMDGRTVFRELRRMGIEASVMILSAFNATEARTELGAEAAMNKPFEPDVLAEALSALVHRQA